MLNQKKEVKRIGLKNGSTPVGARPGGRPTTPWRNIVKDLSWSRLS